MLKRVNVVITALKTENILISWPTWPYHTHAKHCSFSKLLTLCFVETPQLPVQWECFPVCLRQGNPQQPKGWRLGHRAPSHSRTVCRYRKTTRSSWFSKRQMDLQNHVDQTQHVLPRPGPPPALQRRSTQWAARRTQGWEHIPLGVLWRADLNWAQIEAPLYLPRNGRGPRGLQRKHVWGSWSYRLSLALIN